MMRKINGEPLNEDESSNDNSIERGREGANTAVVDYDSFSKTQDEFGRKRSSIGASKTLTTLANTRVTKTRESKYSKDLLVDEDFNSQI